jgi:hypothetical protein
MPVNVNSIDSGITIAVTSAARMFPRNSPVVDRPGDDPRRQRTVDVAHLRVDRPGHGAAVLAHQHEHRAEHHLAAVLGRRPGAQLLAQRHLRDVADAHRHAFGSADDDVAEVLEAADLSRRAD